MLNRIEEPIVFASGIIGTDVVAVGRAVANSGRAGVFSLATGVEARGKGAPRAGCRLRSAAGRPHSEWTACICRWNERTRELFNCTSEQGSASCAVSTTASRVDRISRWEVRRSFCSAAFDRTDQLAVARHGALSPYRPR